MGNTARVWAFNEEERIADIAFAKDAGSLDCFLRSGMSGGTRGEYFWI